MLHVSKQYNIMLVKVQQRIAEKINFAGLLISAGHNDTWQGCLLNFRG